MFNAPRPNLYPSNGLGSASFVDENPLSGSTYGSVEDPWSSPPALPPAPLPSVFGNILVDSTVPAVYQRAFELADPSGSGEVSVNVLVRILSSSGLSSSSIDKIINLVSSRPRVSKLEFYVSLGLVALAQENKDIGIEQLAAYAHNNTFPTPVLNLSSFVPASSTSRPTLSNIPPYSESTDPWIYGDPTLNGHPSTFPPPPRPTAPSSVTGGLGLSWWKNQTSVEISTVPEKQGFILARYTVYTVQTDRGAPVARRYSEFAYLFDCLVRRYPFRLIPCLPPKRFGGDANFLEQRRKGLLRFLRFVVNHPIIREDGLLAVFLTEPNLEAWRRHSSISLEEESSSKRIDRVQEMSIPSDLEERTAEVRRRINPLIEQWTRLCIVAERILKRRESTASDISRLTTTMNALVEENPESWRADGDEFYLGVRQGLMTTSRRFRLHADLLERRAWQTLVTTLEALKAQRDLYIATRDLFLRHDRLSGDEVEKLKKRVEISSQKLEAIKNARKDGWAAEADRVLSSIELDQSAIAAALARRVFIRHSTWHELRIVLYNRENTLLSQALQGFAREEREFMESSLLGWAALTDELQSMPLEPVSHF